MITILVVDDERMIRLGIKAMLERRYNFDILVASDGVEALELLKVSDINIVITDIKMPRMDGIKLIEQMQLMEKTPLVIIVSGYDDFSYAKQAIKYQVMDYILKPVDRNELFNIIDRTKEKIDAELALPKDMDEYRNNQLSYMLLNPRINEEEVEEIFQNLQLYNYPNGFYVGVFHFRDEKGVIQKKELASQFKKTMTDNNDHTFFFLDSDEKLTVLSEDVGIFYQVLEEYNLDTHCPLIVAISKRHTVTRKFKEAYEQAKEALAYKFIYPNQNVFTFEEVDKKMENIDVEEKSLQKIYNMLGTDRNNEIRSTLLNVFNIEELKNYKLTYVYALSDAINKIIFDQAFRELGKESVEIFQQYDEVGDINNFESINDYFYAVEYLTMHLHEFIKEMKLVYSEGSIMEKAIDFIHENAHKDLNMAVVSNHISLNYSYFSHTFKEYTGENFVDYLKKVRIEKAKKLLSDYDNKIFEVSELVGFKNPKQFSRVFRDIEGVSPKEFREKLKDNIR
ncbi:hypothetical protein GCM10011351_13580 [Paraliobacillus quinghaiensis]|uniref:AraC family transcriptional regulator n=1 Tax=Paraliobacillus quinghaiensis TaxID=470815 RepID=A0A917TN18_9BACI|nr:response regulator [Paraliobacillus quinghaiensis]GGM28849.1 hypothetical protein GCM10011351_13580 [Paraliobacillus quinghaiensis]